MKITRQVYQLLIDEAKDQAPLECCGYLAGVDGTITRGYPMQNIDQSRVHYSFLPAEQFATVKKIRAANLQVLAVYHSHPESPANPSAEDIRLAFDPAIYHVIISLVDAVEVVQCFQIQSGLVTQEELTIV